MWQFSSLGRHHTTVGPCYSYTGTGDSPECDGWSWPLAAGRWSRCIRITGAFRAKGTWVAWLGHMWLRRGRYLLSHVETHG